MRHALDLARNGAGHVSPNPLVGAVLVSETGELVGEGWHGEYGKAHAEAWAVQDAIRRGNEDVLERSSMYVTLEPCSHFGRTPPCADLIVEKKIPRVVVAMKDPNPRVAGRGLQRLRDAGIDVVTGVLEHEAQRLNEPFVRHILTKRPFVILKIAQTLDGRIATSSGDSRWVTGKEARTLVHKMRAESDAVLIGSGTAMKDNPALTVRHEWPGKPENDDRQPYRIVLDRNGVLASDLTVFTDGFSEKTIVFTSPGNARSYADRVAVKVIGVPERQGHLSLEAILEILGKGEETPLIQSILIEAGPGLATALLQQDLVDRLELFIAPKILGEGIPAVGNLGIETMAESLVFAETRWAPIGSDMHVTGWMRKTIKA